MIALSDRRPERAIQLIGKAIAVSPHSAEAYSNLGNAQHAARRPAEAGASYRRAIDLDPNFAAAHNNLGRVLCEEGDFAAAFGKLRARPGDRAGPSPKRITISAMRCAAWVAWKPPRRRFGAHCSVQPRQRGAAHEPWQLARGPQKVRGGPSLYRRAIEIDAGLAVAHYGLAGCRRSLGDLVAAAEGYRKVVSLTPDQAFVWNDLGRTLRSLGRFEEAVAAFRQSLAVNPEFGEAYRNLASCQQLTADEQSIARLSALVEQPDLPIEERAAAGFAMGKVLDDADRFEEAFLAYERANRMYRDSRAASGRTVRCRGIAS